MFYDVLPTLSDLIMCFISLLCCCLWHFNCYKKGEINLWDISSDVFYLTCALFPIFGGCYTYLALSRSSHLLSPACESLKPGTSRLDKLAVILQFSVAASPRWQPGHESVRPPQCTPPHPHRGAAPKERITVCTTSPSLEGTRPRRCRLPPV